MASAVVIGGGLAGLTATATILEHGGNVVLIDKKEIKAVGFQLHFIRK